MTKPDGVVPDYREVSQAEWLAEGFQLYGRKQGEWAFTCPVCRHSATIDDYKAAGAPEGTVGFSCVGRWLSSCSEAFSGDPGPCNYGGGGLFALNPVAVTVEGVNDQPDWVQRMFEYTDFVKDDEPVETGLDSLGGNDD